MNPKAGAAGTTPTTVAQRVNIFPLTLTHYKASAVHCASMISVRLLLYVVGWLDALIMVRESLISHRGRC